MKKLVPWLGGKRALARRIAENLPTHTCYVEPFAGGASVFFVKSRSKVEVLNDKHLGLVNLFRVVQRHPEAFLAELGLVVASREWYEVCWAQPGLTDVERAARFYYRVKHTFGLGSFSQADQGLDLGEAVRGRRAGDACGPLDGRLLLVLLAQQIVGLGEAGLQDTVVGVGVGGGPG